MREAGRKEKGSWNRAVDWLRRPTMTSLHHRPWLNDCSAAAACWWCCQSSSLCRITRHQTCYDVILRDGTRTPHVLALLAAADEARVVRVPAEPRRRLPTDGRTTTKQEGTTGVTWCTWWEKKRHLLPVDLLPVSSYFRMATSSVTDASSSDYVTVRLLLTSSTDDLDLWLWRNSVVKLLKSWNSTFPPLHFSPLPSLFFSPPPPCS